MMPGRRWLAARNYKIGLWHAGAGRRSSIGFLTGIVVSTGPISVPLFSAYGLVKGAFIATEAAGSLALYISKAPTFRSFGALPTDIVVKGLITGSSVMAGTYGREADRGAAERRHLPAPARRRDADLGTGAFCWRQFAERAVPYLAGLKGIHDEQMSSAAVAAILALATGACQQPTASRSTRPTPIRGSISGRSPAT